MSDLQHRLTRLRDLLRSMGVDGLFLSTGDEHVTEFPAPYSRRLAWLTGFTGSTATIAVTADGAAIFTDGRYIESVRNEVDDVSWSFHDSRTSNVGTWLAQNAIGKRIGYDPRLLTRQSLNAVRSTAGNTVTLVPMPANPIDALWSDQPARPQSAAFVYPLERAGKSSGNKRRDIAAGLTASGADACVIVALDSIAWLFNIRGDDIAVAPLCYSYAICHRDGTADLFVDPRKIDGKVRAHLGSDVRLAPYDDFYPGLTRMRGKIVTLDPNLTPEGVYTALEQGGVTVRIATDPTVLPKSIKNPIEVEGMKQAHVRDGVAVTRFLHWFSLEAPKGELTELSAAAKLNALRRETGDFHSLAFDPISCADGNAAMPHYKPTSWSDARIRPDSIYLVDSGGQYLDGTTDMARTVAVGIPSAEVRERFTRVLKGYIALQVAVFPKGTFGHRLDAIARQPLWDGGFDCLHGIGHGVGHFLNVHEGPCFILAAARPDEAPIEAGMIISNEPGYYKPGHYGIRTENLMVTVERPAHGGDQAMLGFEPITLAPIEGNMIDVAMLDDAEIDWLDGYHAMVRQRLYPFLSEAELEWLQRKTAPLREQQMLSR